MRVLQVIDSLGVGGSESLAATLAGEFSKRGIGGLVCGLGGDGPLRNRLRQAGVPCLNLDKPLGVRPGIMARLGLLMLGRRCDAVITHHFRQLVHAAPGAALLGRRLIHVEHDFHTYLKRPDILRKLGRLSPKVTRFVFVSREIRDWFVAESPAMARKCIAIPNGVDTARFKRDPEARDKIRQALGVGQADFVVGACARLEPVKDLGLLIRGFSAMIRQRSGQADARLVLVGQGSMRQELEAIAARESVADKVSFAGVRDNVPDWLSAMDAYAITSLDEGLPLAVMEAMSCSLPVVSVEVGSLSRIVDRQVGLLMQGRSPEELGAGLLDLWRDPGRGRALGGAGRQRIVQDHSLAQMAEAYAGLVRGAAPRETRA